MYALQPIVVWYNILNLAYNYIFPCTTAVEMTNKFSYQIKNQYEVYQIKFNH